MINTEIIPYLSGGFFWALLLIVKFQKRLVKYDMYLWSPLVISFTLITLPMILFMHYRVMLETFNLYLSKFFIIHFAMFSQILWFALLLQILAIKYHRKLYLRLAQISVWLGIIPSLFLLNYKIS